MEYVKLIVDIIGGILAITSLIGPKGFSFLKRQLDKASRWLDRAVLSPPELIAISLDPLGEIMFKAERQFLKQGETEAAAREQVGLLAFGLLMLAACLIPVAIMLILVNLLRRRLTSAGASAMLCFYLSLTLIGGIYAIIVPLVLFFPKCACLVGAWAVASLNRRLITGILAILTFTISLLFIHGILR